MALSFTTRQGQVLAFIASHIRMYRRSPSEAEIARHFGTYPESAHAMVVALEKRGLIARTPGVARSIRVLVPEEKLPESEFGVKPTRSRESMSASYPHIEAWLRHGRLEIGRSAPGGSMARVLDGDRAVWEDKAKCGSLADLFDRIERALVERRGFSGRVKRI